MKIQIKLTKKSLDKAIKQLQEFKKQYALCVKEYLYQSCVWVRDRAISYVNASDLGIRYKRELTNINNWFIDQTRNTCRLRLHSFHGYMIEFGVGVVGQGTYITTTALQLPLNYEYNIPTDDKLPDDSWIFVGDLDNMDISRENVIKSWEDDGKTYIQTKGNKALMFLYNAAMDFVGEYKILWDRIAGTR